MKRVKIKILSIVVIMHNKKMSQFLYYDIKSFLLIIFSIQLMILGAIGLDAIGLKIPILRQLVGFIYLTFVPGTLIIRLLKLKDVKNTEILLYIVGLSIITIMITGFILNKLGLYFSPNPLSTTSIISLISFLVVTLSFLCYKFDKFNKFDNKLENKCNQEITNVKSFLSSPVLFLILIPFLSVFGTYMVNFYNNNFLLLLLIIIICFVILSIGFYTKFIPKDLYPLATYVISISILLHTSLIFSYIYGWDIHQEYYFSNLVKTSGFWNIGIQHNINSMLSIVLLAPIYSDICNLDITWVFKIVYPFLFSFLPLGMFYIFKEQLKNDIAAFLSIVYFISNVTFYTEMLALARQQVAELFFVLLVIVMLSSNIEISKKRILAVIFTFGIIISHYGLTYLLLSLIIVGYLFLNFILKHKSDTYRLSFIFMFFVLTISWYMYCSNGSLINNLVILFSHYSNVLFSDIFATKSTMFIENKGYTFWGDILKKLYIISQLLIVIGFIYTLKNHKKLMISKEFLAFSFILFFALGGSLVFTNTGMNLHRLYHISSILLSVYFIIGGCFALSTINGSINKIGLSTKIKPENVLTLFLIIFLLINVGFAQEISNKDQNSISISQKSLMINNNESIYDKSLSSRVFYRVHIPIQDLYGTTWLSKNRDPTEKIYVDSAAKNIVFVSYGMMPYQIEPYASLLKDLRIHNSIGPSNYVYLKYNNVIYGFVNGVIFSAQEKEYLETSKLSSVVNSKNKIYTNGANYIFK